MQYKDPVLRELIQDLSAFVPICARPRLGAFDDVAMSFGNQHQGSAAAIGLSGASSTESEQELIPSGSEKQLAFSTDKLCCERRETSPRH